jgi:hypothetical protein
MRTKALIAIEGEELTEEAEAALEVQTRARVYNARRASNPFEPPEPDRTEIERRSNGEIERRSLAGLVWNAEPHAWPCRVVAGAYNLGIGANIAARKLKEQLKEERAKEAAKTEDDA